jgi:hypothetical protein
MNINSKSYVQKNKHMNSNQEFIFLRKNIQLGNYHLLRTNYGNNSIFEATSLSIFNGKKSSSTLMEELIYFITKNY